MKGFYSIAFSTTSPLWESVSAANIGVPRQSGECKFEISQVLHCRARLQGGFKGCVNAAGKARQKWQATAEMKFTKPGARLLAEPCTVSVVPTSDLGVAVKSMLEDRSGCDCRAFYKYCCSKYAPGKPGHSLSHWTTKCQERLLGYQLFGLDCARERTRSGRPNLTWLGGSVARGTWDPLPLRRAASIYPISIIISCLML